MSELNDFFLKGSEPTKKETRQFYEKCNSDDSMNFYQIDISEEALKFSEEMNLCERGMNVDLESEKLNVLESLPKMDMVIATGCIGYIWYKAFSNLLKVIKNRQSNSIESETGYIAQSLHSLFLEYSIWGDIEKVFEMYGYSIVKSDIKPIRQRNFSDSKEKAQAVYLLHDMEINTKRYEDDGNFYADFYIAKSKN